MNKLELIEKLQMVYVGDRNALNELVGYYDGLKKGIEEIQQELNQKNKIIEEIKNNLKNSIKVQEETYKKYKSANINIYYASANKVVLDLIEKLEKGSEEND